MVFLGLVFVLALDAGGGRDPASHLAAIRETDGQYTVDERDDRAGLLLAVPDAVVVGIAEGSIATSLRRGGTTTSTARCSAAPA